MFTHDHIIVLDESTDFSSEDQSPRPLAEPLPFNCLAFELLLFLREEFDEVPAQIRFLSLSLKGKSYFRACAHDSFYKVIQIARYECLTQQAIATSTELLPFTNILYLLSRRKLLYYVCRRRELSLLS